WPALGAQPPPERIAAHQLHRDEYLTADLPGVVDANDVRVLEPGHGARLADQARSVRGVADVVPDHLDRDQPGQFGAARRGDRARAALPEGGLDDVAAARVPGPRGSRTPRGTGVGTAVFPRHLLVVGRDRAAGRIRRTHARDDLMQRVVQQPLT